MKKFVTALLTLLFIIFACAVIYYAFWPLAKSYIYAEDGVGDASTHLANIVTFSRHRTFPIKAWQGEWFAGYPMVEGYPWLHYFLIQPVLSFFDTPGLAMDYYGAILLLIYYLFCFLLLYYTSRNAFLALLFSLVLVYGADSSMPLFVNAFTVFTASQFLLPLNLLLVIIAREKKSIKLLLVSSFVMALSFYAHGAMTYIVMLPIILPFLIFNKKGNITKKTIMTSIKYFTVFALLSSVQIYQFLAYYFKGQDVSSVARHPLKDVPARYLYMFSWQNPVLLPLLILFVPVFIFAARKSYSRIKPYLYSLLFIFFFFSLMVFKITGMVIILLGERALWGISLAFLMLFAAVIKVLIDSKVKRSILVGIISLMLTVSYLYFTLIIKHPLLVPDISKPMHQYTYSSDEEYDVDEKEADDSQREYRNKYDRMYDYTPLSWNQSFDNYRTDGISYNIYSSWALWSANPRYKGRYPAMKGLPLHWSGLVSAAEYGMLGEAGAFDNSKWAMNQAVFFFDWYGIRHFEIGAGDPDLAGYLRKEPFITSTETSLNLIYYSMDKKFVGPIYAPTNAKTMAVVAPEAHYDNFIRTLSYSEYNSKQLIPIYLGSKLGSLKKENLKYFDAVFIYDYKKPIFSINPWGELTEYVKGGGNLIIETGQKVSESEAISLPEVFPMTDSKIVVVNKPWNVGINETVLTEEIEVTDFTPLTTKYKPFAISEAKPEKLKEWAEPVLTKHGSVVMAMGEYGEGKVVWSGLNMPFHAIDNRNVSETIIFANILDWFFPDIDTPIEDFNVDIPGYEKIVVKGNQGKGVLIKEHYNPGWSAKVNGKKVKIFKAGLFLMYVPLESEGNFTLELKYNGAPIHWILFTISSITFMGILIYLFLNKNQLLKIEKLISLTRKDDEEDY